MNIKDTIDDYINSLVSELHLSKNTKDTYKNTLDKYYYCFFLRIFKERKSYFSNYSSSFNSS